MLMQTSPQRCLPLTLFNVSSTRMQHQMSLNDISLDFHSLCHLLNILHSCFFFSLDPLQIHNLLPFSDFWCKLQSTEAYFDPLTWWRATCCVVLGAGPGHSACTDTRLWLWLETLSHTHNRSPAPDGRLHLEEVEVGRNEGESTSREAVTLVQHNNESSFTLVRHLKKKQQLLLCVLRSQRSMLFISNKYLHKRF